MLTDLTGRDHIHSHHRLAADEQKPSSSFVLHDPSFCLHQMLHANLISSEMQVDRGLQGEEQVGILLENTMYSVLLHHTLYDNIGRRAISHMWIISKVISHQDLIATAVRAVTAFCNMSDKSATSHDGSHCEPIGICL